MSEPLTKSEVKRLRESLFYKVEKVSDFKQIRHCYEIAKSLYEALKYFDARASRSVLIPPNQAFYDYKRRRSYPEQYYNFSSFYDCHKLNIYVAKFKKSDFCVCIEGAWRPSCVKEYVDSFSASVHRYCVTNSFEEVVQVFEDVVYEFCFGQRSADRVLFR